MELPMVTVKIQSIDDILKAYLKSLGFREDIAQKNISLLKTKINVSQESGDKVIDALDNVLLATAKHIFKDSTLDDEQMVALFKFCFLQAKGAEKWGDKIFETISNDSEIAQVLRKHVVHVAPNYVFSQMKPQEIDIPHPSNLLKKIFKHKKR